MKNRGPVLALESSKMDEKRKEERGKGGDGEGRGGNAFDRYLYDF
jgi:hypothetical protein